MIVAVGSGDIEDHPGEEFFEIGCNIRTPDIPEFAMIPIRKSAADLSPDRPFLCR
jgi:hypothetical protein